MAPALGALHKGNGGLAPHKGLKSQRPSVVDAHHHLVMVDGASVRRVQQHAAILHHHAGAVPPPSTETPLLLDGPVLLNGLLHALHQMLLNPQTL